MFRPNLVDSRTFARRDYESSCGRSGDGHRGGERLGYNPVEELLGAARVVATACVA